MEETAAHPFAMAKTKTPTWRGVAVGALLIPVLAFWNMYGWKWGQSNPATVSLFFNVVTALLFVSLTNAALHRFLPRLALSHGEMVIVYVMLSVATAICGLDFMQVLIPIMTHPIWFASASNKWGDLFLDHIPRYLVVNDLDTLRTYHQGHSELYTTPILGAWLTPVLVWGTFIFVLVFGMLCINVMVRKEWAERARLSFPIVQLPLEMTRPDGRLFKSKLMWAGFATAFFLDFNNGVNVLVPTWPSIGGVIYDLLPLFPNRPWNAMGWTPIQVFPFAVGLGFFIPLDLSFSCWFFYLFWKAEKIISSALGYWGVQRAPFVEEQNFGAYLTIAVTTLWMSRQHLKHVFSAALPSWLTQKHPHPSAPPHPPDEPLSYRAAVWGFLVCLLLLCGFSVHIGMTPWVAVLFFAIYFALSTAITRMRAELGTPVHDLHLGGPHNILTNALGTKTLGTGSLTVMSFYHFFNRAYRGHPIPHQLEGMKMAQEVEMRQRNLLLPMLLAIVIGIFASYWAGLDMAYHLGGHYYFGRESFNRLATWIGSPTTYDTNSIVAVVAGVLQTLFLTFMRLRYVWWAFHPAGFAVSGSWSMNLFWLSLLVAWGIKSFLFKYAGIQSYRRAMPFFMGLILGDFAGGAMWTVYGIYLQRRVYNFLP